MKKSNQSAAVVTNIYSFGQINMPYGCSIRDDGTIMKLSVTSSLAYFTLCSFKCCVKFSTQTLHVN